MSQLFTPQTVESFLTTKDIPPNLKNPKIGETLFFGTTEPRTLSRGDCSQYRLKPEDKREEARAWLKSAEGRAWVEAGPCSSRDLVSVVARAFVHRDNFGGPDRGIYVRTLYWCEPGESLVVTEKKVVLVGTYFPPVSYDGEYDGDPGGLSDQKSVVLVKAAGRWWISGDLVRA